VSLYKLNQPEAPVSPNLLRHETLHVSDSSSEHHQEFNHCKLNNGICHTAFEQDQDGTTVPSWSCSKADFKPVWLIQLLSVQWINSLWWTEDVPETHRISFFFFYCRYNPLWILAFSVIFSHSALPLHSFLHYLIPIICISSSMSSIHLFLGLPLFLLPFS